MRARNIKPGFFKNELLGTADPILSLLFEGLWLLADRDGRLEDRPLRIKAEIFPYRDGLDINGSLTELERMEFIERYVSDGCSIIQVLNFRKHQTPHKTEKASILPIKPLKIETTSSATVTTQNAVGEITEPLPPDLLIPDSPNPDSQPRANATPFQRIYETGCELFPQLAPAATGIIHQWLSAGCDPELDAIPEIRRHAGKPIRAWTYFTGGVMDAKATRETIPANGVARRGNTAAESMTVAEVEAYVVALHERKIA